MLEARKELAVTSVLDKDWDSSVVPKILQLAQKTLPDLSHGFGTGLFTLATAFWLLSASAFASSLRELRLSGFFRSFNLTSSASHCWSRSTWPARLAIAIR